MASRINEIEDAAMIAVLRVQHQLTGQFLYCVQDCPLHNADKHDETLSMIGEIIQVKPEDRYQVQEIIRRYPIKRKPMELESETEDRINRKKEKVAQQLRREGHTPIVSD